MARGLFQSFNPKNSGAFRKNSYPGVGEFKTTVVAFLFICDFSTFCTFPENTEPAATGQGVVSADFSTPTGERPSRARRGSPR